MRKLINKLFSKSELDTNLPSTDLSLDDGLKETISHLMGYDEANEKSVFLRSDANGALLTSRDTQNSSAFDVSIASVTTSATAIVGSNTARKGLAVYNGGSVTVYVLGVNTVTTGNGFPIPPNSGMTFDNYLGALFGIAGSGSNDVRALEL